MRVAVACIVLAASLCPSLSNPAKAEERTGASAVRAAASIVDIRGSGGRVWIVRRDSPRAEIPAKVGEFLYAGDRLFVRGQSLEAELLVRGVGRGKWIREGDSPYRIEAALEPTLPNKIYAFLSAVSWPWAAAAPTEQRSRTHGRGTPEEAAASPAAPPPIRYSNRLSEGAVIFPASATGLTLAWCGEAAYGEAYGADDKTLVRTQGNVARLNDLRKISRLVVNDISSPTELSFSLKRKAMAEMPRPSWLSGDDQGPEEEIAWGVWLLRNAAPPYRAFGLTLLDSHRLKFPAAQQYFEAVTDCESNPNG